MSCFYNTSGKDKYVSSSMSKYCNAGFFMFYLFNRKIAMRNLFYQQNRRKYTKKKTIDKGPIGFGIYFANKSETASNKTFTTQTQLMFLACSGRKSQ